MISINQEDEVRCQHFAFLKDKYQASSYEGSSPSSPLYLILRKADLGLELSELELNWLKNQKLTKTIEIILIQHFIKSESTRLEAEFSHLKAKYKVSKTWEFPLNSFLSLILWKLDKQGNLDDSEIQLLRDNNLVQIVQISQDIKHFSGLKQKYQATQYTESFPDNLLYPILKKLDKSQRLDNYEYDWLLENEFFETIEIFEQQELEKREKFIQLKEKYKATKHPDVSLSSKLYEILQKLEGNKKLNYFDEDWLKNRGLTETIEIAKELEMKKEFIALKVKYQATKYADSSTSSELYLILKKLESEHNLSEDDLKVLQKHQLTDTLAIANEKYAATLKRKAELGKFLNDSEIEWLDKNEREDIINFAKQKHFTVLKRKYGLIDPTLPIEPFYTIMLKLENKERLDSLLVIKLMEKGMLSRDGKIATAHYRLEAEFYEQEYKRTGNKWKIPTASSCWRKANEAEQALKITNLDLAKIKESNLKSAILVTRGAAFRDIDRLDDAEICAMQAIDYQSETHQPYTLMGAICYDRYEYEKGDYWFEQAIQRGAETEDIDAEIKQVIKNEKNDEKRNEAAEYLLNKDSKRYAWAKDYLKKQKDKK